MNNTSLLQKSPIKETIFCLDTRTIQTMVCGVVSTWLIHTHTAWLPMISTWLIYTHATNGGDCTSNNYDGRNSKRVFTGVPTRFHGNLQSFKRMFTQVNGVPSTQKILRENWKIWRSKYFKYNLLGEWSARALGALMTVISSEHDSSRTWLIHMCDMTHPYSYCEMIGSHEIASVTSVSQYVDEWVMSHISMSHVTHINESCHANEWVMSHISMSHVTHE